MADLENNLKSIGMKCFVDYYEYFKMDCSTEDMITIMPDSWTKASKQSRTSVARAIFRDNLQCRALEIIFQAERVDSKTRNKARLLLQSK